MHTASTPPQCEAFARQLGCQAQVVNGVCLATRTRSEVSATVLGRRAASAMFLPQLFSFESQAEDGTALCLGETVLVQEEVEPFLARVRQFGATVTALHNHWLFDQPQLLYLHFQALAEPMAFAAATSDAMRVLIPAASAASAAAPSAHGHPATAHPAHAYAAHVPQARPGALPAQYGKLWPSSAHHRRAPSAETLCEQFNRLLGGDTHTEANGVCTVMKSRNGLEPVTIMGRPTASFLATPEMYTFEDLTPDGRALCSGETVLTEEEVEPFLSVLMQGGVPVTALHNHWLFDSPRLMYMHFVQIAPPVAFAETIHAAQQTLRA